MKKIFEKSDYRASSETLVSEIVNFLAEKFSLPVYKTLIAQISGLENCDFSFSNEYSSMRIKTMLDRDNESRAEVFWSTSSSHEVLIESFWESSKGSYVRVSIGDDESSTFYPDVKEVLKKIPLLNREYNNGKEKIIISIGKEFNYNGRAEGIGPNMTHITIEMARSLRNFSKKVHLWGGMCDGKGVGFFSDSELKEKIREEFRDYSVGVKYPNYITAPLNKVAKIFYNGDIISLLEKNPGGPSAYMFLEVSHNIFDKWLGREPFVEEWNEMK